MANPISVSVIVPTLNCARLLPAHLASMQPWIDLAREIIVVDSHSEDGTVEIIRSRLRHPALRIVTHPRGLYQSWNHGVQQAVSSYVYISTVGDAITRRGLEQLHDTAERLACDVAISKPRFIKEDDRPAGDMLWPIDDILSTLNVRDPVRIESLALFLFTAANVTGAILGSSASNLYRTAVLKQFPFPVEYGTVGDGAWGVSHVFDYRLGVLPGRFSTFRDHPKTYNPSVYAIKDLNRKLFQLLCEVWEKRLAGDPALQIAADRAGCQNILAAVHEHIGSRERLEALRASRVPWPLNPGAWRARRERAQLQKLIHEKKREALKALGVL